MTNALLFFDMVFEPNMLRKPVMAKLLFVLELLVLAGCLITALLLVLAQIGELALPGCGALSDCTRAAGSQWGKLPGTEWPLSFLGFAYFQALVATFIYGSGRLPTLLRVVVGIGAIISTLLTAMILREGYVCGYCLTIHLLNITFAIGHELSRRLVPAGDLATPRRTSPFFAFIGTFAATSLLLLTTQQQSTAAAQEQLKQALDRGAPGGSAANRGAGFSPGRYYFGPKTAKVQVVVVSDYQCPTCRTIDAQLRAIAAGHGSISISARHFPFCTDCNKHIDKTRHLNACRAALAAEAAGIVGGPDAFWQMHDWLFERRGSFTDDELRAKAADIGLDPQTFFAAFHSEQALAIVRQDAADADAVGLRFTPMVFINGHPLELEW